MKDALENISEGHREVAAYKDKNTGALAGYTEGPEDLARSTLNEIYPERKSIGKGIKG